MKIKHFLCLCISIVLLLSGCGTKGDETPKRIDGTLHEHTYSIPAIAMQLKIPSSFTILTGNAIDAKTYGADASAFYKFIAKDDASITLFTCFMLPKHKMNAKEYLLSTKEQLEKRALRTEIGEVQEETINAFPFFTLRSEMDSEHGTMQEYGMVYEADGWLICFDFSYPKEKEQTMEQTISEIIQPIKE